ncbi:hypothetical protein HVPorG_04869 [Roseomonas mucosa]|nr:hypothetical protein HVPorG_04869 [Roseomonas mucosa]
MKSQNLVFGSIFVDGGDKTKMIIRDEFQKFDFFHKIRNIGTAQ